MGSSSRHTRARLDVGDAFAWLAALRRTSRITVPLESRDELIDVLLASSPNLASIPDDLQIERVRVQLRTLSCGCGR